MFYLQCRDLPLIIGGMIFEEQHRNAAIRERCVTAGMHQRQYAGELEAGGASPSASMTLQILSSFATAHCCNGGPQQFTFIGASIPRTRDDDDD